jgi:PPOX class probable FMN-dependent enzyme
VSTKERRTQRAPFADVVTDEGELRSLFRETSDAARRKQIDRLDEHCRIFIAHAPFVLVATSNADGTCDVSPRGGPPGFVAVLDDYRLAIGDLPGNKRVDSFSNLVTNAHVGLLFVVPGLGETLRVNGNAWVVRDPDVLDACTVHDRRPPVAIGVEVADAYIHCAKAFRRSNLWDPDQWPDRGDMPSAAAMLREHAGVQSVGVDVIEQALEDGYAKTMW